MWSAASSSGLVVQRTLPSVSSVVRGSLLFDCASQPARERLDLDERADGGLALTGLHRGHQQRGLVQQLTGGLEQRGVHGPEQIGVTSLLRWTATGGAEAKVRGHACLPRRAVW